LLSSANPDRNFTVTLMDLTPVATQAWRRHTPACHKRQSKRLRSRVLRVPVVVWIAELLISDRTANKIAGKHGLETADVRAAILCGRPLLGKWSTNRHGKARILLRVQVAGRPCIVVIYPAGDDVWHLASAYVLTSQKGA